MAKNSTVLDLLADVAEYADVPPFTTTTLPTKLRVIRSLNKSLYRLALKHKNVSRTGFTTSTIAAVSGTTSYALPSNFIDLQFLRYPDGGSTRKIEKGTIQDIANEDSFSLGWTGRARYVIALPNLLVNDPRGSFTVTIGYLAELLAFNTGGTAIVALSADTDFVEDRMGIDEWIALDVAKKIKGQQDQDISSLVFRQQEIEADLVDHLNDLDPPEPMRVVNSWDRRRGLRDDDLFGGR